MAAAPKPTKGPKRRTKEAPSIMQDRKECYLTGATHNLHRHEVFFGRGQRQKALEWGCWVYLRGDWHNQSNKGVHFNKELDDRLKQEIQKRFMELYGFEKFVEVFGKNYV